MIYGLCVFIVLAIAWEFYYGLIIGRSEGAREVANTCGLDIPPFNLANEIVKMVRRTPTP